MRTVALVLSLNTPKVPGEPIKGRHYICARELSADQILRVKTIKLLHSLWFDLQLTMLITQNAPPHC